MKNLLFVMIFLSVALSQTSCNTQKHTPTLHEKADESEIFSDPEQQPYYLQGDKKGLMNDLYSALLKTAPATQECISGRAVVRFDISEDGRIDSNSIKVIRNLNVPEEYVEAAIGAIKSLGRFEPGKMNGIPIKVSWTLPIIYPVPLDRIIAGE